MAQRTGAQIEQDRALVWQLSAQGVPHYRIAEIMGAPINQISSDFKAAAEAFRKRYDQPIARLKERELAKLDELERVYWDAWKASGGQRVITTVKETRNGTVKQSRTFTADADTETLQGVERIIQQRRAIIGIDAPRKKEITGAEGRDLVPLEALRAMYLAARQDADPSAPAGDTRDDEDDPR